MKSFQQKSTSEESCDKRLFSRSLMTFYGVFLIGLFISPCLFGQYGKAVFTEAEIQSKIQLFLIEKFALTKTRFEVQWKTRKPQWRLGQAVDSIVVRYRQKRMPKANTILLVEAMKNGKAVRRISWTVYLRCFESVAVAQADLPIYQALSDENIIWETREITQLPGKSVNPLTDISKYQSKRRIKKGEALTHSKIQPIPLINRGDPITLLYSTGAVQVKLSVNALQSGTAGKAIWVVFPDNQKRYKAKVISRDIVEFVQRK